MENETANKKKEGVWLFIISFRPEYMTLIHELASFIPPYTNLLIGELVS
mgnify:CR=1 FL=1